MIPNETWARIYRCTARVLLPRDLRNEYMEEMAILYRERLGEAGRRPLARAAVVCLGVADLLRSTAAHLRAARRQGSSVQTRNERNDQRGITMERWGFDLKYAVRTLRGRPLFAGMAILTLGLGIGSATTMFSVVETVLFAPLPFANADQLVSPNIRVDHPTYAQLADETTALQSVAALQAFDTMGMTATSPERRPYLARAAVASASLLSTLGIEPALGRWFEDREEGRATGTGARVVVLGGEFWRSRFSADPGILGRTIMLDQEPHVVIGVLPDGFRLRFLSNGQGGTGSRDVWIPVGHPKVGLSQGDVSWEIIARLAPGRQVAAASGEFRRIALGEDPAPALDAVALLPRASLETRRVASQLMILWGATGLLLLIACGNVSTLILGEAQGRTREMLTRTALGASRAGILRQLLIESLVIGLIGSALGTCIAIIGTRVVVAAAPPVPRITELSVNSAVLAFSALLGVGCALLFGIAPALAVSGRAAPEAARCGGGRTSRHRFERGVLVAQVALTSVLLVLGGLLGRSLDRLYAVELGFAHGSVATMKLNLPKAKYFSEDFYSHGSAPLESFYQNVFERIAALPGVESVSASTNLPFQPGVIGGGTVQIDGRNENASFNATRVHVLPGYFETLDVPLVSGRTLTSQDGPDAPLAMVLSESLARTYWPEGNAIGAQVSYWRGTFTVVGVVGDVVRSSLASPPEHVFYVPLVQTPRLWGNLVARVVGDPAATIPSLREAVWAVDPDAAITEEGTLEALRYQSAAIERFRAVLMSMFATIAAVLSAVGIFGLTGRTLAQRRQELGVRIAIGAEIEQLIASEVRRGLALGAMGVGIGLALATWASRLVAAFLFGVGAVDLPTYGWAAVLVLAACVGASYLPARRIAGLDPARVLRGS